MTTTDKQRSLAQWFSPDYIAQAMWDRAKTHNPERVLEPAAGKGSLILPLDEGVQVYAVEIDQELVDGYLAHMDPPLDTLVCADFMEHQLPAPDPGERFYFDVGLSNPPYEDDRDLRFVEKLFAHCAIVIVCVRVQFKHRVGVHKEFWSRPDVCLTWESDCISRPRFGGPHNPNDEYVLLEICHGPQQPTIEFSRLIKPARERDSG